METKKVEAIKNGQYAMDGIGLDVAQFNVGDVSEVKASVADSMIKNGFAKLADKKPVEEKRSTKKEENKRADGKKEDK